MKILPVRAKLFHEDRYDAANSYFCSFLKAPKKGKDVPMLAVKAIDTQPKSFLTSPLDEGTYHKGRHTFGLLRVNLAVLGKMRPATILNRHAHGSCFGNNMGSTIRKTQHSFPNSTSSRNTHAAYHPYFPVQGHRRDGRDLKPL